MEIKTINEAYEKDLYGCAGMATDYDFATEGRKLMDKMWALIKTHGLKHKGINYWYYEGGNRIFTAVELDAEPGSNTGLEHRKVLIGKYAYYKHIGPYNQLADVYRKVNEAIHKQGLQPSGVYLEIYGHWTEDETKLETEIVAGLL